MAYNFTKAQEAFAALEEKPEACPVCGTQFGKGPFVYPEGTISIAKAAEQLGLGTMRVRSLCRDGKLEGAVKTRGRWLIPETSLEGYAVAKKAAAEARETAKATRAAKAAKEAVVEEPDEDVMAALDELLAEEDEG